MKKQALTMAEAEGGSDKKASGVESLKDKGNEQFKAGNFLKAAALYTQAIKQDPQNPTLYRYLAHFKVLCFFSFEFDLLIKMPS